MASQNQPGGNVCPYYLQGDCRLGDTCRLEHPPELSSVLRPIINFPVSDRPGEACQRCIDHSLPCDKLGRHEDTADPCSECRHFGGEEAKCVLAEYVSRNDQLWRQMMSRASDGYTLPEYKARDAPRKRRSKKITPQPMRDENVMPGWTGQTREQLLDLGDMLPDDMRARPRAYLSPAGFSHQDEKRLKRAFPER